MNHGWEYQKNEHWEIAKTPMLTVPRLWLQTVFLYRSMFIGIPPPFACSCPTCCRTWAWCCRSLKKILAWQKTDRNNELIITTNPALLAKSWEHKEYVKPVAILASRKQTTRKRTRLKVTVCLYLNPSNSARSLSCTLMAVAVARENPQKVKFRVVNSHVKNKPFAPFDLHHAKKQQKEAEH